MRALRSLLLRAGRRLSTDQLAGVRVALSYLELGAWAAQQPARPAAVPSKFDLFRLALGRVRGAQPLYLEFGVYRGRSIRWWAEHLTDPRARFIGFDSFERLPEDWRSGIDRGYFATGGPPQIPDQRVSFEVGWFDETLPRFWMPERDQLIVNIDCDLYSNAATVLGWLDQHLRPGDLLYFDELPDRHHELRALREFLDRTRRSLTPLGYARGGAHWLFECAPSG